jgi:hypothetical protein
VTTKGRGRAEHAVAHPSVDVCALAGAWPQRSFPPCGRWVQLQCRAIGEHDAPEVEPALQVGEKGCHVQEEAKEGGVQGRGRGGGFSCLEWAEGGGWRGQ